jgi:LacI family transcriptional regulator
MNKGNVTLKEIALKSNTSVATVHRVLNNKEGVGEELREKILKISQELGYTVNFAASSLKKKPAHFVVIFPEHDHNSKYYVRYMEEGYKKCKEEINAFNIELEEIYTGINEEDQIHVLQELFYDESQKIDGLILSPYKSTKISTLVNRFIDKGVPVVLMDRDLPKTDRLTCVKPNNLIAGKIAGELLSKYLHKPGKVIIADGDSTIIIPAEIDLLGSNECENMLRQMNKSIEIERVIETSKDNLLYHKMLEKLANEPDIIGIYTPTARNTVQVGKAITELGLEDKIIFIGSEIFEENIEMLNNGVIDTIIYKNPFKIGYESLNVLFNYVMKGETPKEEYTITPKIILKSNLLTEEELYYRSH